MRASGQVVQVHDIPPFSARSSKRTVRLINGIALDECRARERYPARRPFRVPIAQNIEQTRPKRQVAGESPAGDTNFTVSHQCGCGSTAECGRAKAETTVRLRSPAPISFWGRSSSAERSFDMREAKRAALFAPTIFRGHSSASQSGCFTCIMSKVRILLPSPFLSLWCSQVNMPAPHAGDHRSEAGQGRKFHRPQSIVSDAFAR